MKKFVAVAGNIGVGKSTLVEMLCEKLGWEPGILNGKDWKPKGMHWKTFERLTAQHDVFMEISLSGLAARLHM